MIRKNKNEENIEGRQKKDWWRGFQGWNNAIPQFFFFKSYVTIRFKIRYLRERKWWKREGKRIDKKEQAIDK